MMKLDSSTILNNRYRLQQMLGYGGFSQVWHAWDENGQYEVAIKVFLRQDEEGIRMCREEFDRTNRLRHDRLIRLLDFNVHEEAPYLVMPYYHRKTLEVRIGDMDEVSLWRVMRDIASGLEHIHGLNPPMVHNDLKPDNFLIDDHGGFVLTDFGISTELADKMTRSRDFTGVSATDEEEDGDPKNRPAGIAPRAYRAPELFHYRDILKNKAIKSSDIWAFGACLHELAVGEPPFGDQGGLYQLMHYRDYGKLVPELVVERFPEQFSTRLVETVYSCLSFLTWDRPVARKLVEIANQNMVLLEGRSTVHLVTPPVQAKAPEPPAEQPRVYTPEYKPPAPIVRRSLQNKIPAKNREMPVWLWILLLIALAVGVFFALEKIFGTTPKIHDQNGNTLGVLDKKPDSTNTIAPGPAIDSGLITDSGQKTKSEKKKRSKENPVPDQGSNLSSKGPVGPPFFESIGTPSTKPGYHIVIMGEFSREDSKETIKILKEAFPGKNVWATDAGWGRFKIKLGSFSSEKKAQEFQVNLSNELEQSTALTICRN